MARRSLDELPQNADDGSPIAYREVVGFDGWYAVGDDGSVWSCRPKPHPNCPPGQVGPWKRMRRVLARRKPDQPPRVNPTAIVILTHPDGSRRTARVSHLVLEAFVGPCPSGLECCHENDVASDNRLTNLRWDTRKANIADAIRNNRFVRGSVSPRTPLTEEDVVAIRRLHQRGTSVATISDLFHVSRRTVEKIVSGRTWKHVQAVFAGWLALQPKKQTPAHVAAR